MIAVALKGMAQRRLRLGLTALAIVLGVALVSGSFVVSDTINRGFDTVFSATYHGTDAVVSGRKLVDYSNGGNATLSRSVLERVKGLPDVAAAAGSIIDLSGDSARAKLIDRNGKPIESNAPTFGVGIDPAQPRFNPMTLTAGRWPSGPGQVAIDAETASSHHFGVGDGIGVAASGPAQQFRIVGISKYGGVANLGGATFAVFSIGTAQALLGIDGYTGISVAAKPGVSTDRLVAELRQVVPASVKVNTAAAQAAADKESISGFLSFMRWFLLGFGGIALLVGGFVIFNTLSITVAQRARELATLRTLGASRGQLLRSVVLEAFVLGAGGSAIGLLAGLGLARGLTAIFGAVGLALPQSSTVFATHTVVASLVVGTVATVLAGLVPAVRATRVPPIAAVREGAVVVRRRRPLAGLAVLATGGAALGYAVLGGPLGSSSSLIALAAGTLLALVGAAAVSPWLVGTLARLVGVPSRRLGGAAGTLAAENAVRNPGRTASTAAALMIGLALVSFVAVLGSGLRSSLKDGIRSQVTADWVVTSKNGWSDFPVEAGQDAARAAGVTVSTSVRADRGRVAGANVNVNGIDPATIADLYSFRWKQGSDATLAELDGDGAIVEQAFARKHDLRVGQRFTLRTPAGRTIELTVAGTYQPPRVAEVLGGVLISQTAFDAAFSRPANSLTLLHGGTQASIEQALARYPDAELHTRDGFAKSASSFVGQVLNLLYILLALSVIVSLLGMVNTLVLSVFERRRELGMLRAVGMTRRQVRRMVRHESVITALIGAAIGLPLGILLAAGVTHGLVDYGVSFSVPVASILVFALVAIAAGVVAAVLPARRASRIDTIAALQYS